MKLNKKLRELVVENIGVAHALAHKFHNVDDSISISYEALCKSALTYKKKAGKFSTWAHTVIQNKLIDQTRLKTVEFNNNTVHFAEECLDSLKSEAHESTNGVDINDLFEYLFKQLQKRESDVFKLLLQDVPTKEIAKKLGVSRVTVNNRRNSGIAKMSRSRELQKI